MRHIDATGLRDLPTAGDHVGTLAKQLHRQARWQLQGCRKGQRGALQLRASPAPCLPTRPTGYGLYDFVQRIH